MTKPAELQVFAQGVNAPKRIRPSKGRRDAGFRDADRVPPDWINWFFNSEFQWFDWVQRWEVSEQLNWTGVQTFSGGLDIQSHDDIGHGDRKYILPWGLSLSPAVMTRDIGNDVDESGFVTGSNNLSPMTPLPVYEGHQIKSIGAFIDTNGGQNEIALYKGILAGNQRELVQNLTFPGLGAPPDNEFVMTLDPVEVVPSTSHFYWVEITMGETTDRFYGISYTISREA